MKRNKLQNLKALVSMVFVSLAEVLAAETIKTCTIS